MKRIGFTALIFLLFFNGTLWAGFYPGIFESRDWSKCGERTRENQEPLLILFVSDGCNYCKRLKAEYLHPMLNKMKNLLIREVNIDKGGKMKDFDGIPIRSRLFTSRYNVFATPTLIFLDSNGNALTTSIVGYDDPDNYKGYMEKALSDSRIALNRNSDQADLVY